MTDENTQQEGAGEALPANPPKSDAEAAQQEAAQQDAPKTDGEQAPKDDGDSKRKNRTKQYIDRLNSENSTHRDNWNSAAALRRRLEELEPQRQQGGTDGSPTLADYNNDFEAWLQARDQWLVGGVQQGFQEQQQRLEAQRHQETMLAAYNERATAFAESHPDFQEAISLIDPRLMSQELLEAVLASDKGPEVAYYLANDDEALFNIASIRPELQAAAVERLASRLGAAQQPAQPAIPAPTPKPISQAPIPPPRVGGRSAIETPAEKLTDDQWYARDRESRRSR